MSITITKQKYIHTSAPARLIRDINWDEGYYTIAGLCTKGARFYSENIFDIHKAKIEFEKYAAVVKYFGGGTVNLYNITNEFCDIIRTEKID